MVQYNRFVEAARSAFVSKDSRSAKALCAAIVVGWLLSFSEGAMDALTVKAGTLFPPRFHIWTVVTAPFMENYLLLVLLDLFAISFLAKVVSPLWGEIELLLFFFIVNISTVLWGSIFYLAHFAVKGNAYFLYDVSLHGMTAFVTAITVGVKQIMPDHVIFRLPLGKKTLKFRNRNVPLTYVIVVCLLAGCGVIGSEYGVMTVVGFFTSFFYLRFYQRHGGGEPGDMSEAFAFAT